MSCTFPPRDFFTSTFSLTDMISYGSNEPLEMNRYCYVRDVQTAIDAACVPWQSEKWACKHPASSPNENKCPRLLIEKDQKTCKLGILISYKNGSVTAHESRLPGRLLQAETEATTFVEWFAKPEWTTSKEALHALQDHQHGHNTTSAESIRLPASRSTL